MSCRPWANELYPTLPGLNLAVNRTKRNEHRNETASVGLQLAMGSDVEEK